MIALATIVIAIALVQLHPTSGARSLQGRTIPSTTVTPTNVAAVAVDPNTIVGLTAANASDLLSKAGLSVATKSAASTGAPAGIVTAVEPSGQVAPGTTVTLTVSSGPVPTTTAAVTTVAKTNGKAKGHKPKG